MMKMKSLGLYTMNSAHNQTVTNFSSYALLWSALYRHHLNPFQVSPGGQEDLLVLNYSISRFRNYFLLQSLSFCFS